jgi:hypothetical protein
MNGLFRKNGQQAAVPRKLNSSRPNGRRWITVCALVSLFLNILIPISQANHSVGGEGEFVEICTQSGIKLVSVSELFSLDTGFTDQENCPVCSDCPLCWQAQSTVVLPVQDIWKTNAWRHKQVRFAINNEPVGAHLGNSWPDSRAPPRI